ncbi:O-methyltransferase [Actinomycetospora sp. NBRC 106375]|uniref:O-methyltransferase n=1 Tax=Actinomycetospora sp. NBRC 106375 TaxID=3032207 RepID=UPI0024A5CF8D|nr:class I SAM-dependent methyltransferase [Actinomycetospora sp. NBRC 106375]GLZ47330.1 O-methyltransferase [Actinomycetospora sp. NBRC 106375]
MTSTLDAPAVHDELTGLLAAADAQEPELHARLATRFPGSSSDPGTRPTSDEDVADLLTDAYIAVPREVGELLALLLRATGARTVVEFGTSFGISTIYLAAALRDNGGGRVITTEIEPAKADAATASLRRCGLDDLVDVRVGDARETLRGLDGPVDVLLLDGWSTLYLPVLEIVEPALRPGALVVADDTSLFPESSRPTSRVSGTRGRATGRSTSPSATDSK